MTLMIGRIRSSVDLNTMLTRNRVLWEWEGKVAGSGKRHFYFIRDLIYTIDKLRNTKRY